MKETDAPALLVQFTFNPASGLFSAELENGTVFSVAPNNVSGKLGSNLDLLRQYTMRDRKGEPPAPHPAACGDFGVSRDAKLVAEAIVAGRFQRVGVIKQEKRAQAALSLEDLDL